MKPLKNRSLSRAPAVSDRIEAIRLSRRPLPSFHQSDELSSLRAIHADVLKGMISYRIGFSECEHGPASNRQHARKRLFNESRPACQEQNSHQSSVPPNSVNFARNGLIMAIQPHRTS